MPMLCKYLIKSSFGPEIAADATLDTCTPSTLLVPGGIGVRQQVHNAALQQWIRRYTGVASTESTDECAQPPRMRKVLAICSGVALLSTAGCLDNKRATTSRRARDWVQRVSRPHPVQWQYNEGSLEDGIIICSPGVADAMDAALHLIAEIHGESMAIKVSELTEYRRGTPRTALNHKGSFIAQAATPPAKPARRCSSEAAMSHAGPGPGPRPRPRPRSGAGAAAGGGA